MRPSQILHKLCKESKLDGPHYQRGYVRIGNQTLTVPAPEGLHQDSRGRVPCGAGAQWQGYPFDVRSGPSQGVLLIE